MRRWINKRRWILAGWLGLLIALAGCGRTGSGPQQTDFERELNAIDDRLAELPSVVDLKDGHANTDVNLSEVALLWYRRASLTDSFEDLESTATAIELAARLSPSDDLLLLQAQLDSKLHRVDDAQETLDRLDSKIAGSAVVQAMRADIDLHRGLLLAARRKYELALEEERSWHTLARLAHLQMVLGDFASAERLYRAAQDEITVKERRAYAWTEVQRGKLDVRRGCFEEALSHYRQADQAYSGDWYVATHLAEVYQAMGEYERAAELYVEALAQHQRPELCEALGNVHAQLGDREQSRAWREKAVAAYLESANRGDGRYFHHLVHYYVETEPNGAEAVKWASMDLAQREGTSTRQALAWALCTDGQHASAEREIRRAISSGAQDPQLFAQASAIFRAAGHIKEATEFQRRAEDLSATHQGGLIHVHRATDVGMDLDELTHHH